MIASRKRDAGIGIAGGLLTNVTGTSLGLEGPALVGVVLVGFSLYAWGAASLAEAKGYRWWWGLLALVTVVGMLVLVAARDRHRDGGIISGWPEELPRVP